MDRGDMVANLSYRRRQGSLAAELITPPPPRAVEPEPVDWITWAHNSKLNTTRLSFPGTGRACSDCVTSWLNSAHQPTCVCVCVCVSARTGEQGREVKKKRKRKERFRAR